LTTAKESPWQGLEVNAFGAAAVGRPMSTGAEEDLRDELLDEAAWARGESSGNNFGRGSEKLADDICGKRSRVCQGGHIPLRGKLEKGSGMGDGWPTVRQASEKGSI